MSERTFYSEEAKNSAYAKLTAISAICLALGATIGTAIAVLFAPKSGEETREELGSASNSAVDRLQDQMNDLRKRFDEFAS